MSHVVLRRHVRIDFLGIAVGKVLMVTGSDAFKLEAGIINSLPVVRETFGTLDHPVAKPQLY